MKHLTYQEMYKRMILAQCRADKAVEALHAIVSLSDEHKSKLIAGLAILDAEQVPFKCECDDYVKAEATELQTA